jgi:hypothetical protein
MFPKDWFRHSEVNGRQRSELMNVLLFFFEIRDVGKNGRKGNADPYV